MAPTLKEINGIDPSALAAGRGKLSADVVDPAVVASSPNKFKEAPASNNNSNRAIGGHDNSAPSEAVPARVAPSATETVPDLAPSMDPEDPNKIPDDESAFLVPPHFSRDDPFHRDLSELDRSMRCAICSDFFHAPVSLLPCLHTFCSLCVRNHFKVTYTGMKRKANCPQCHEPVRMPGSKDFERGIRPNKQMEQQVDIYRRCRDQIREKLVMLDYLQKEKAVEGTKGGRTATDQRRKRVRSKDQRLATRLSKSREVSNESDSFDDCQNDQDLSEYSSPLKMVPKISTKMEAKQCPDLKRRPIVSYHGMKRKKLVELCEKDGLCAQGTDEQLKARHSYFSTLVNAECDSDHPRSTKELSREVKSRESSIKAEATLNAKKACRLMHNLGNSLKAFNEGTISRPTSGSRKFDAELKSGFANLIADAKKGKGSKSRSGKMNRDVSCVSTQKDASQLDDVSQIRCANAGVDSPSTSIGSDKTAEAQGITCSEENNRKQRSLPPRSKASIPNASLASSPAKMDIMHDQNAVPLRFTRVSSIGAWTCSICTYDNIRNTTRKARCEMCNSARPQGPELEKEVVNIDC